MCARYEPAGDGAFVGGDWYDVFDLGEGRVAVAVGDVAGRDDDRALLAVRRAA